MRLGRLLAAPLLTVLVQVGCTDEPPNGELPAGRVPVVLGVLPASSVGTTRSVITLVPEPPRPIPVPAQPVILDQFGIAFSPKVLVVRAGQVVAFRNSEEIDHNVLVVEMATDSTYFHVATPAGDPYHYTFDRPGGYTVSCDIHPGMVAVLVVVSAPYSVVAEEDGGFAMRGVPPGRYLLNVWNADSSLGFERSVEVGPGRTELELGAVP